MEAFPVSPGARAGPECVMCTSTLSRPATCIHIHTHTHQGSHLPSWHCHPRAQATHTLWHPLLLLTPTPKHSQFPTITMTPQAHILTVSYSQTVSLPPVIRSASSPAKLLSHARSLIPPYSQPGTAVQAPPHHTHTHPHNCLLSACPPHPSSVHGRNEETQGTSPLPQRLGQPGHSGSVAENKNM